MLKDEFGITVDGIRVLYGTFFPLYPLEQVR